MNPNKNKAGLKKSNYSKGGETYKPKYFIGGMLQQAGGAISDGLAEIGGGGGLIPGALGGAGIKSGRRASKKLARGGDPVSAAQEARAGARGAIPNPSDIAAGAGGLFGGVGGSGVMSPMGGSMGAIGGMPSVFGGLFGGGMPGAEGMAGAGEMPEFGSPEWHAQNQGMLNMLGSMFKDGGIVDLDKISRDLARKKRQMINEDMRSQREAMAADKERLDKQVVAEKGAKVPEEEGSCGMGYKPSVTIIIG